MLILSSNIVVIFGVDKFLLFDVGKMEISESVKINNYVEKIEAKNNYVIILTSDEDGEHKIAHCWKIDPILCKVQ
jgi:predicted PolB exonuclease-like 3'-5' exonuclease